MRLTRGLLTRAVVFCIWGRANMNQPRSIIRAYASIYPREDEASAEILHEVRQEGLSYVALVETLRSRELAFCGLKFLRNHERQLQPRKVAQLRITRGKGSQTYGCQPGAGSLLLGSGHCDW